MTKDWTGNYNSIFKTLGASNHTDKERENNDYYATEPKAIELLLQLEPNLKYVWECACGEGHLAEPLRKAGMLGRASDLVNRAYGESGIDFLLQWEKWNGDIITNPPYKLAQEFCEHAINLINNNSKVCMFLKLQFLEGKARKKFFEKHPPKTIYVSSSRLNCAMNGDFEKYKSNNAVCYAWYVWEKGYSGNTNIKWFN